MLLLTNDKNDPISLTATKYYQGRTNPPLFGAPYHICLGFPLNNTKSATRGKIVQQRLFLELYWKDEISQANLLGSSQFLVTMLHGGRNVESIAYTEAHRLLLLKENSKSKVSKFMQSPAHALPCTLLHMHTHTLPCTLIHNHAHSYTTMHTHTLPCTLIHYHAHSYTIMHTHTLPYTLIL